ncbi:hypothetical protein EON63_22425 [archaeon]|nr:MAG: hypothetical protein EON63_22425 [archaeon]
MTKARSSLTEVRKQVSSWAEKMPHITDAEKEDLLKAVEKVCRAAFTHHTPQSIHYIPYSMLHTPYTRRTSGFPTSSRLKPPPPHTRPPSSTALKSHRI